MKRNYYAVLLVIAAAFAMVFTGCGGEGGGDPIKVNLSLPNVAALPDFNGTFVSSEPDALNLIDDLFDIHDYIMNLNIFNPNVVLMPSKVNISENPEKLLLNMNPSRSTAGRYVDSDSYEYTIGPNYVITPGVTATGFIQESWKAYWKDNNNYSVGDWYESSERQKLAVNYNNYSNSGKTVNGKMTSDWNDYYKEEMTSVNPPRSRDTSRFNSSGGASFSVSDGSKGLKFVMKFEIKHNYVGIWDYDVDDYISLSSYTDSFSGSITIYDNNNAPQFGTPKTFNDMDDFENYLGFYIF